MTAAPDTAKRQRGNGQRATTPDNLLRGFQRLPEV